MGHTDFKRLGDVLRMTNHLIGRGSIFSVDSLELRDAGWFSMRIHDEDPRGMSLPRTQLGGRHWRQKRKDYLQNEIVSQPRHGTRVMDDMDLLQ